MASPPDKDERSDDFRAALAGVEPLAEPRRRALPRARPRPLPQQTRRDELAALAESLSGPVSLDDAIDSGEALAFGLTLAGFSVVTLGLLVNTISAALLAFTTAPCASLMARARNVAGSSSIGRACAQVLAAEGCEHLRAGPSPARARRRSTCRSAAPRRRSPRGRATSTSSSTTRARSLAATSSRWTRRPGAAPGT